jgi:DNA-binding LytR/AlgR family response regulator
MRENEKLIIIFITALFDFIQEGYEVSALHYLVKPVKKDKLFETLGRALKKIQKPKKILLIDADGVNFKIPLDEIIYIEAFGHSTTVNTINRKYDIQQNIGQIEKELDNNFIRCHRSYIAGLKYIRQISKTEILLDNGNTIQLSRRLYHVLNQAFINYYKIPDCIVLLKIIQVSAFKP